MRSSAPANRETTGQRAADPLMAKPWPNLVAGSRILLHFDGLGSRRSSRPRHSGGRLSADWRSGPPDTPSLVSPGPRTGMQIQDSGAPGAAAAQLRCSRKPRRDGHHQRTRRSSGTPSASKDRLRLSCSATRSWRGTPRPTPTRSSGSSLSHGTACRCGLPAIRSALPPRRVISVAGRLGARADLPLRHHRPLTGLLAVHADLERAFRYRRPPLRHPPVATAGPAHGTAAFRFRKVGHLHLSRLDAAGPRLCPLMWWPVR